jgi:hypothetical protein
MKKQKQIRASTVNKAIADLGGKEILVKGDGYWYFAEGDSAQWPSASVYCYNLNTYSLEEWVRFWKHYRDKYLAEKENRIKPEYTKDGALKIRSWR